MVREPGDRQRRLRLLDGDGDDQAAVREMLFWSYKHLPADAARLFRELAATPAGTSALTAPPRSATSLRTPRAGCSRPWSGHTWLLRVMRLVTPVRA
ncbi:hypothetical protein [Amycolatopsis coloradensis]|uniref:hypothetical protein n=1 Tax=Amycolatopsis coloradensis TaxID=76021 RepID=UPI001177F34E|nr:hypothetical protein [Amycolatopsis coloradensis]